jgi:agmatinase
MTLPFNPGDPAMPDSGIFGLPRDVSDQRVILIPVPWEATTSYRGGTAEGPAAILHASHQVDLHDIEVGDPWATGIVMLEESSAVRAWNAEARALAEPIISAGGRLAAPFALTRVNTLSAQLNAWLEREVGSWLDRGRLVGLVGGDHSTSFGAIAAVARRHPGVGVLQIDAHADLRTAYEGFEDSHASIMYNVMGRLPEVGRLVQVGLRDLSGDEASAIADSGGRIVAFFDAPLQAERFAGEAWAAQCQRIIATLPREVFVSFDIDGLDPSLCPSTGTPVPGGLRFSEATYLLRLVAESGRRIAGFDLNEVAPGSGGSEWDANVGARLLYKMIGWALRSNS